MDKRTITNPGSLRAIARSAQSGQAIVLVALVMIILLGILGLAIDGGGLYFLWRDAQNADDAAVLAAAYARCTGGDMVSAALQAAAKNGFDNNGVTNKVAVYSPPIAGSAVGKANYIQVDITAQKQPYFIQLVYKNPLMVTTRAVGFCNPALNSSNVPAVMSLSTVCPQAGIHWTNSESYIEGGMFSNTDIDLKGGGQGNKVIGGSGAVETVNYQDQNTGFFTDSNPPASTTPTNNAPPKSDPLGIETADYAPQNIHPLPPLYTAIFGASDVMDPQHEWSSSGGGTWNPDNGRELEGVYYVNGNVTIGTGVNVDGDRNGDGNHDGLTIVATGTITINTGPGMYLHYYEHLDGVGFMAFSGADPSKSCSTNALSVSGSAVGVKGIFYAPYGGIDFNLSSLKMYGAIIGQTITMGGSKFELYYDDSLIPPRPPSVQVAE